MHWKNQVCLLGLAIIVATGGQVQGQSWRRISDSVDPPALMYENSEPTSEVVPAMWQPSPLVEPRVYVAEGNRGRAWDPARVLAPSATSGRQGLAGANASGANASGANTAGSGRAAAFGPRDRVVGREALPKATADLGDLLKKSSAVPSVQVQAKTPVVHDPRIRGSRVGALAAAGSHWVPARADLDTIVSKFDSRQIAGAEVIAGPYTSMLGPGFEFIDVEFYGSPRYAGGLEAHGSTDLEYRANGAQHLGQQTVLLGAADWGARFGYTHRGGNDYLDGNRTLIPAGYQSQEMTLALGRDWQYDSLELNILRLDQHDVIFPGYVFDIDDLVTDGYEVRHLRREVGPFDSLQSELYYNRTSFNGQAQNRAKRRFFPILDAVGYQGFTDVDSMSVGYRQALVLGGQDQDLFRLAVGHDLRFVKQELNEISNSVTLGFPFPINNRNSPIPKSTTANPGVFAEYEQQLTETTRVKTGGRVDMVAARMIDDANKLAIVGLDFVPTTYAEVVGTDQYSQNFNLVSGFLTLERQLTDNLTTSSGIGYAERAPTLTELYAAEPFMALLQNGLNNVTGDPTLARERLLQVDWGLESSTELQRSGIRGYYSWAFDYITFENTLTTILPPGADTQQVSLRYVNTDLATLAGMEAFSEWFPQLPWTPFSTIRFVEGRDRSRNGNFATTNGTAGNASAKDPTNVRGAYSGVAGGATEALPGIPPLEARLGIRFHDTSPQQRYTFELSVRLVDNQRRVASSLLETPTAGFSTWDLRSVFRPTRSDSWVVASGVENMFDRQYREHFDYRTPSGIAVFQPGANFYVSSNLQY